MIKQVLMLIGPILLHTSPTNYNDFVVKIIFLQKRYSKDFNAEFFPLSIYSIYSLCSFSPTNRIQVPMYTVMLNIIADV